MSRVLRDGIVYQSREPLPTENSAYNERCAPRTLLTPYSILLHPTNLRQVTDVIKGEAVRSTGGANHQDRYARTTRRISGYWPPLNAAHLTVSKYGIAILKCEIYFNVPCVLHCWWLRGDSSLPLQFLSGRNIAL